MLSFGVFCFDLVVNKNCSLGDHGEDLDIMDKTEILLRLFHFFSGVIRSRYQDKTEFLLRLFHFFSGVIRPLPSTGDTYFLSGLSPQKKIFHDSLIFLKVRKCAVLAVYV